MEEVWLVAASSISCKGLSTHALGVPPETSKDGAGISRRGDTQRTESQAQLGARESEDDERVVPIAAAVVPDESRRVLLVRERDRPFHGRWVIPMGHVRRSETVPAAAEREVREEVGLHVSASEQIGAYDAFEGAAESLTHYVLVAYVVRVRGGRLRASPETIDYAWVDPREVTRNLDVPEEVLQILRDYSRRRSS